LKRLVVYDVVLLVYVAPLAGAWIETSKCPKSISPWIVAPLAGAWIETRLSKCLSLGMTCVAPLAGAWIETTASILDYIVYFESHPSRVRGLKHHGTGNRSGEV